VTTFQLARHHAGVERRRDAAKHVSEA
jgi:hypothetical protein